MNAEMIGGPMEGRITRLEVRMDYLETETRKQTNILEGQNVRLLRIERLIYILIGVVVTIEFGLKLLGLLK